MLRMESGNPYEGRAKLALAKAFEDDGQVEQVEQVEETAEEPEGSDRIVSGELEAAEPEAAQEAPEEADATMEEDHRNTNLIDVQK